MSIWRPPAAVRVKVLGLLVAGDHLLAADVLADDGTLDGVRPLGGSVEFGETREAALRREFREELGAEIDILGPWSVFENIFVHEGETGHEIVFIAPIHLRDLILPVEQEVLFEEASGERCRARWHRLADLRAGRPALYPDGLAETL